MRVEYNTKIMSEKRLKDVSKRLTQKLVISDFCADIECICLLQELLSSTGIDPVEIQKQMSESGEIQ